MSLKDELMSDLKVAMREKNKLNKSVITMLRAAIKQVEVDQRVELSDDEIVSIIAKQIKQKNNAIEEFTKGEREDLVEEAKQEIAFLMKYLPEQLTEEELRSLINDVITELGASTMKDMGKVMGALNPKIQGKADTKLVSTIVKEKLS